VRFIKRLVVFLVLVLVLIFGMLFAVQNTATVPVDLLLVQFSEQRISVWLLLAFALGGVIGVVVSSAAIIRLKSQLLLVQRKLGKQDKVLAKSRADDF
jgi:putative membrane protein